MSRAGRAVAAAAMLAALWVLSGCATPQPKPAMQIVLLPQADGSASAVIVNTPGGARTLSEPYQRATVHEGGTAAPVTDRISDAQARADFAALINATPPRPERFVVFFETGGTRLTTSSQAAMSQVLQEAFRRSGAELVIIGHTDTQGTGSANDALSLRRAGEVRDLFTQRGFAAERIETAGRGERELAVPTADEVDEPRNRRVEILVR